MHEHVLAAAFRRNESEALCGVEELHGTDRHSGLPVVIEFSRRATSRERTRAKRDIRLEKTSAGSARKKRVVSTGALRLTT
jgi:hypothetical protein